MKSGYEHLLPLPAAMLTLLGALFFFSLPDWLLQKRRLSLREWLPTVSAEGLIQLSIQKPFLERQVFKELAHRSLYEHKKLAQKIKDDTYPERFRIQILRSLSLIRSPAVFQAILFALEEDSSNLRIVALHEARKNWNKKVIQAILALLEKESSKRIISFAMGTLEYLFLGKSSTQRVADKSQIEQLKHFWKTWWEEHKDKEIWDWIKELLDSSKPEQKFRGVQLALEKGREEPQKAASLLYQFAKKETSPYLMLEAISRLNRLDSQKAFSLIQEKFSISLPLSVRVSLLGESLNVWREGRKIQRPFSEVFPLLKKALSSSNPSLVRQALRYLGFYKREKSYQILRKFLHHSDRDVRYEAAWALARLGAKDGVVVAKKDLDSPEHRIRAISLLRRIFKRSFGLGAKMKKEEVEEVVKKWKNFLEDYEKRKKP